MKKTTLFKMIFLGVFILSTGSLFGGIITIIPDQATTGSSATAYVATLKNFTSNGVDRAINNWNPSTLQVRGNTTIASDFQFYNTTAIPGIITKVTLNESTSSTTFVPAKITLITGNSVQSGTSIGTAGTSGTNAISWTPSVGNTFFRIQFENGATSGTARITSIVIEYANPTITVTETSIPAMLATNEVSSDSETINIAGTELVGDISITITGTNSSMFSVSPSTLSPVSGSVASTPVVITYTPTANGNHSATLNVLSNGATTVTRELSGSKITSSVSTPSAEQLKVYVTNDKVMFRATAGESVKIFNSIGQVILNKEATEGLNEISVTNKGLHIIKVGNKTSKIIL